jgi:AraC family transcriptional regulator
MQKQTTLYIKNMVCQRCKTAVKAVMETHRLQVVDVQLGEVEVLADAPIDLSQLDFDLRAQGFELIHDRESQLVSQIKANILEYLNNIESIHFKLSDYLADKTDLNYSYLSKVFSRNELDTIERYFILLKIEKVKELLIYHEYSLSAIAHQLGYSSTQALSGQFKTVTGMTVSQYKEMASKNRVDLDRLR